MSAFFDRTRHPLRGLYVLLALTSCSVALAALPFDLPPVSNPASTEHHPGKVIWADLVTPNLGAAENFYGGLFGWTFQTIHTGDSDYAIALLDGRPIAGMLQKAIPAGEKRRPAWLTFIAVRDVEPRGELRKPWGQDRIRAQNLPGARSPGGDRGSGGRGLCGARLGKRRSAGFSGVARRVDLEFIVREQPGAECYVLQRGLRLRGVRPANADGAEHLILSSEDYARAAINRLPPGHRHPHWLNFVRVEDAVGTSAKAVELGGRVAVEPFVDRHGGKIAVIVDPTGAAVGVMEWSEADTKVEPK